MSTKNGASLARRPGTALMREPEEYMTPGADIFETADAFILKIDMPGASKESVQIFLEGDLLTVRGSVGSLHEESAKMLVQEIAKTSYYRIFNLGRGVDKESIKAEYEEGVLTIHVPKTEDMKSREIPIQ